MAGTARPSTQSTTQASGLRAGSLDLSAVLMQSITTIGPALAAFFTIQFITATTGIVAPLALLVGGALLLLVGITLAGLASRFPSAGGYYTYISRTLHPRAGFLTSWVFFLWSPIAPCFSLVYVGYLTQQTIRADYGINLPWWLLLVVVVPIIAVLTYFGIRLSAGVMLVFGLAEIIMVLVLAIWGLANPGPGGLNVHAFNPGNAISGHGFYLAVVFTIFSYVGWEAAAPLGEESKNPRRNVPAAIIGSIIFMIAFLVLCAWAFGIGWGTDHINGFISDSNNPMFTLAQRFWGGGSLVVLLAVINSTIAFTVSSFLVSTRMIYAMGRTHTLPPVFARLDTRRQTPVAAILVEGVLLLAVGFIAAAAIGLANVFFFFGLMVTYVLIFIYVAGNIGAFWYYTRGAGRDGFSLTRHVILPIVSTVALVFVGYESINPLPSAPLKYAPIVAGAWILAGVLLLVIMNRLRRETWLLRAGEVTQTAEAENQSPATSHGLHARKPRARLQNVQKTATRTRQAASSGTREPLALAPGASAGNPFLRRFHKHRRCSMLNATACRTCPQPRPAACRRAPHAAPARPRVRGTRPPTHRGTPVTGARTRTPRPAHPRPRCSAPGGVPRVPAAPPPWPTAGRGDSSRLASTPFHRPVVSGVDPAVPRHQSPWPQLPHPGSEQAMVCHTISAPSMRP